MGVVVGFVDRNPKKEGRDFYNAAAFLAEGKIQAIVHKTLLPTYDVFDEDRYFARAASVKVVDFAGERIGVSMVNTRIALTGEVTSAASAAGSASRTAAP